MLDQIGVFLVETVFGLFVFLFLARFHFQWLRVPFRNPVGEFVLVMTSWAVMPMRRVIPGFAGLDLASLLAAWLGQIAMLWLRALILTDQLPALTLAFFVVALVDLLRYSLYLLSAAIIVQAVFSWINPYSPVAPVLDTLTRPFYRPLRRYIAPVGKVDLVPLVVLVIVQVVLIMVEYLRRAATGLG